MAESHTTTTLWSVLLTPPPHFDYNSQDIVEVKNFVQVGTILQAAVIVNYRRVGREAQLVVGVLVGWLAPSGLRHH